MATIKSYTDINQSKKLAEILPLESADMWYINGSVDKIRIGEWKNDVHDEDDIPCWSLAALHDVLPEIYSTPLTLEKVKAEDGYKGYYYPIKYKGIVLIPYSKNPVDACYEMILKLHELNLL